MLLGTHYATKNAAIESVHLYSHYTVTANSQCPTSATTTTLDFIPLSTMFEGTDNDEKRTAYNLVKRSIAIMPDYEGYGVSIDRPHPYLAEAVTARQVVNALTYGLELYGKPTTKGIYIHQGRKVVITR